MNNKKNTVDEQDIGRLLQVFQKLNPGTIWSKVTDKADFVVRRFPQGFVNDICCCELTGSARERLLSCWTGQSQPDTSDIVVKFLFEETWFKFSYLEIAVTAAIVSEAGISPQLLFVDEKCHIHRYVESRQYGYEDDCDPETVARLARLLARMHALRVPVSNMAYLQWTEEFQQIQNNEMTRPFIEDHVHMKVLEERVPHLKDRFYSVMSEMTAGMLSDREFQLELQKRIGSPIVFCHNDFNRGNRLVETGGQRPGRIYLVDHDYANYNERGRDLGRYFSNFRHRDDMFGNEGFPSDGEMDPFLEAYLQEITELQGLAAAAGDRPAAYSMQQLRDESKVFAMGSYLDDCWFAMMMIVERVGQEEQFMGIIANRFRGFQRLRKMFTEDGTIERVMARTGCDGAKI